MLKDLLIRKYRRGIQSRHSIDSFGHQQSKLSQIGPISCDTSNLKKVTSADLTAIFESTSTISEWNNVQALVEELKLPELTGGVNPGDQRALFSLIASLRPNNVLEIGTHIGCSTVHIALALRYSGAISTNNSEAIKLRSVDIRNVNDLVTKPWEDYGSPAAPCELLKSLGCDTFTSFSVSPSIDYLRKATEKFDFIFLDGLHDADAAYQEIPLALEALASNGSILLHDYFPNGRPLWEGHPTLFGPYTAVRRLQDEGTNIEVVPLGEIPWRTKQNSRVTSLAILSTG